MGVGGQRHAPASLSPGKTRYPLYRRLGGPQGRPVRVRKILPPPGFDPRTVQPVASHYFDWAIVGSNWTGINVKTEMLWFTFMPKWLVDYDASAWPSTTWHVTPFGSQNKFLLPARPTSGKGDLQTVLVATVEWGQAVSCSTLNWQVGSDVSEESGASIFALPEEKQDNAPPKHLAHVHRTTRRHTKQVSSADCL